MAIPKESLALIKRWEGYLRPLRDGTDRVKPYLCPANVPTIGYGSTFYEGRKKVRLSDPPITRERAEELLAYEIGQVCEPGVDKMTTAPLHELSRGALVSFAFNCGTGAYQRSTLRKRVNEQRWNDVPRELSKWTRGGGRTLKGLVSRRKDEALMFMAGVKLAAIEGTRKTTSPPPPPTHLPPRKPPTTSPSWWQMLLHWIFKR